MCRWFVFLTSRGFFGPQHLGHLTKLSRRHLVEVCFARQATALLFELGLIDFDVTVAGDGADECRREGGELLECVKDAGLLLLITNVLR